MKIQIGDAGKLSGTMTKNDYWVFLIIKKSFNYFLTLCMDKRKCIVCNKTLVAIGLARKNVKYVGKCHNDWSSRQCHKKCLPLYHVMLFLKNMDSTDKDSLFKCDMENKNV